MTGPLRAPPERVSSRLHAGIDVVRRQLLPLVIGRTRPRLSVKEGTAVRFRRYWVQGRGGGEEDLRKPSTFGRGRQWALGLAAGDVEAPHTRPKHPRCSRRSLAPAGRQAVG